MDILFVSSAGGHLAQLVNLQEWWRQHRRLWVTFDMPDAVAQLEGEDVIHAHHPTTRNVWNLLKNFVVAWRVLRDRRPDVIMSTGAGVALPFFVVGWLLRIPRIYIEVYDRIDSSTMTGRLCRPFTTRFCVQWDEQLEMYPGATVVGSLF